ncbi:MAG: SIS domain-containing protein [Actinomycetota bacterium]
MAPPTMLEQALEFPRQITLGLDAVTNLDMPREAPRAVALCGLGGSAAGGRLFTALFAGYLTVPAVAVDTTSLPGWIGEDDLVVCTSYSGNTRETLDLWEEAGIRGARRIAVTAGGELAERAARDGCPCALVEAGYQPRGALGFLLGAQAAVLTRSRVAVGSAGALAATVPQLTVAVAQCQHDRDALAAEAAQLAGKAIVLYGSGARAAAALRLKNQINENAKAPAFANAMPEMAHNEVLGWIGTQRHGAAAAAIFLRDPAEPEHAARLHDRIEELVRGDVETVLRWEGSGEDEAERTLGLLIRGDVVSCLLAEAEGVDALDIARLTSLKGL